MATDSSSSILLSKAFMNQNSLQQQINVQNISLYTCQRRHAMTDTSKTAKIIKR